MGIFSFLKKGRTFQDGTFVKPFTDREKKAARASFEKLDRLADKALRPFLGSFNVELPRKLKQLEKKLSRLDLRKLHGHRLLARHFLASLAPRRDYGIRCPLVGIPNDASDFPRLRFEICGGDG